MPYRDRWVMEILGSRSVLEAALDVHSTARGSMERSRSDQDADAKALARVVATWKNHGICKFDDLVLELIKESLSEWSSRKSLEQDDDETVLKSPSLGNCGKQDR